MFESRFSRRIREKRLEIYFWRPRTVGQKVILKNVYGRTKSYFVLTQKITFLTQKLLTQRSLSVKIGFVLKTNLNTKKLEIVKLNFCLKNSFDRLVKKMLT